MNLRAGRIARWLLGRSPARESPLHPTQTCAECGTPLMRDGATLNWQCPNLDCPAQIRARLEHWCSPAAMDIAGTNAALVATLVARGLTRDVAELYRLTPREIAALDGMTADSARRLCAAIRESRTREAWRLLFGLGIPGLDAESARSLCRRFGSVDAVFAAGAERLVGAEGLSAETARGLVHWHGDAVNRRLIKRLFKAGLNFKAGAGIA